MVAGYRLQVTVTSCRLTITGYRYIVAGFKLPVACLVIIFFVDPMHVGIILLIMYQCQIFERIFYALLFFY